MVDNKNKIFNSKYSKTLTIVLILVIISIIGLLIFFGIDVYRRYYIQQASGDAFHEFQNQFNEVENTTTDTNIEVLNNIEPSIDLNTLYQNTITDSNNSDSNDSDSDDSDSDVTYMGYNVIGTIEIPATDVEYPIIPDYQGSINSLNVAIVMLYPPNIGLNEVGNAVLAGHNYRNGTFFSNNKRLQLGDKIYITDTSGERVEYEITRKYETDTGDSAYMNRDTEGRREISLTTCTDDTSRRLIIWAQEVE